MNEVSTTVFTEQHYDIKRLFINKAKHLMDENNKIKGYSVQEEYNGEVEQLQIDTENYELTIRCRKKN